VLPVFPESPEAVLDSAILPVLLPVVALSELPEEAAGAQAAIEKANTAPSKPIPNVMIFLFIIKFSLYLIYFVPLIKVIGRDDRISLVDPPLTYLYANS
jgi:amino acid transporter